jgi:hypothetical protein
VEGWIATHDLACSERCASPCLSAAAIGNRTTPDVRNTEVKVKVKASATVTEQRAATRSVVGSLVAQFRRIEEPISAEGRDSWLELAGRVADLTGGGGAIIAELSHLVAVVAGLAGLD